MTFGIQEDFYCLECLSPVMCEDSTRRGDDYEWCCSNPTCCYANAHEGTGDMDEPAWVVTQSQLDHARTTDPWALIRDLGTVIQKYQGHIDTIATSSARNHPFVIGTKEKYKRQITEWQRQREALQEVVAAGQPYDYVVILHYQLGIL